MEVPRLDDTPIQPTLPGIPAAIPAVKRYAAEGKQVLRDCVHYADAATPDAASCIVDAMNAAEEQAGWVKIIVPVK